MSINQSKLVATPDNNSLSGVIIDSVACTNQKLSDHLNYLPFDFWQSSKPSKGLTSISLENYIFNRFLLMFFIRFLQLKERENKIQ
jgi:hypothetical protein